VSKKQGLIAIVDDDESVRRSTKALVRSTGLAAEAYSSGEEFLRSSDLSRTACLVTDINMPALRWIRRVKRGSRPVMRASAPGPVAGGGAEKKGPTNVRSWELNGLNADVALGRS
jgi:CheY-like chemotaxis protein